MESSLVETSSVESSCVKASCVESFSQENSFLENSCTENFAERVNGSNASENSSQYKNTESFINLRPDVIRRLPALKHHAICAIGPHKNILLELISQYKYGKKRLLAVPLASMMARQILSNYTQSELPKLIIPVPMHPLKRMLRGFNQTEILSEMLSSRLQVHMSSTSLARVRYTRPQAGKTGKQRRSLAKEMFVVKQTEVFKNLSHIALLDDVITTGSTMLQLIQAIKKVNPDIRIDLWCLSVSL